ncbi:hypothetical protein BDV06DRAFT_223149 [Aspergillus oleicola]
MATEQKEGAESQAEDPIAKELEEKKKEVVDLEDKYVCSIADFLNLQERTKRDMDNTRNFDHTLLAVPKEKLGAAKTKENKDLLDLVNEVRPGALRPRRAHQGWQAPGFDPKIHEATFMTKVEGKEDGEIMYTQSKGFMLNGRVLRAAKVGVVKNN